MADPRDDLRHELRDEPFARESLFYSLLLPDEGLMVFMYTWVGADGAAGHLVTVVEGENERLAFSAVDGIAVGDADFGDWEVEGLRVRHTDLLQEATLSFDDPDLRFELTYTATHPAFLYSENAGGCAQFVADDRFEQSCRVRGTVEVAGRTIAVDTTGHRDHSWGTRDWDTIQDWKWISGQAEDGTTFNLMRMHARGDDYDNGYVARGGEVIPVVDIRAKVRFDERWWQTGGEITVVDERGGTTRIELERYALFRFEAGDRMALHEAACTGSVDGSPARIHIECGWDKHYAALQADRSAVAA